MKRPRENWQSDYFISLDCSSSMYGEKIGTVNHYALFWSGYQKSVDATEADKQIVTDLLDTLRANLEHCVGMAANMIGVNKNIIVVAARIFQFAMIIRYYKEIWSVSDLGRMSYSERSKTMHEISGNRSGLS